MTLDPIILIDVENVHRDYPETFEILPAVVRHNIPVDRNVKLLFADGVNTERMWVRITDVEDHGYRGSLASVPAVLAMAHGDVVRFQAKHIASLEGPPVQSAGDAL